MRERRVLPYHADCWTDVRDAYGQLLIEASTMRSQLEQNVTEVRQVLREHAETTDLARLARERTRNQTIVGVSASGEAISPDLVRRVDLMA